MVWAMGLIRSSLRPSVCNSPRARGGGSGHRPPPPPDAVDDPQGTGLALDLVYNPLGAFLPPLQAALEARLSFRELAPPELHSGCFALPPPQGRCHGQAPQNGTRHTARLAKRSLLGAKYKEELMEAFGRRRPPAGGSPPPCGAPVQTYLPPKSPTSDPCEVRVDA